MRHRWAVLAMVGGLVLSGFGETVAVRAAHSGSAVLPDLGMLPPRDFSIDRRPRGGRLLRFDTIVVNVGAGAFDVFGYDGGNGDGTYDVTQRIEDPAAAGGWAEEPSAATMFFDGDGHRHWHVWQFQEWTITNATANAPVLSRGAKTGFCFWDNYDNSTTNGPALYSGSTSCHLSAGRIPMGLAPGWGDEYPSNIAGQYIDISQLGYGTYVVTVVADQRGEFIEASDVNNRACARIQINNRGARVLASGTELNGTFGACFSG